MDCRGSSRGWTRVPACEPCRSDGRRNPIGEIVWQLIKPYAASAGVPGIAPHDLRRTCAKLCRAGGGELEQIQLLLGHASVQTTERYLGTKQDLVHAPNDSIKLSGGVTPGASRMCNLADLNPRRGPSPLLSK